MVLSTKNGRIVMADTLKGAKDNAIQYMRVN